MWSEFSTTAEKQERGMLWTTETTPETTTETAKTTKKWMPPKTGAMKTTPAKKTPVTTTKLSTMIVIGINDDSDWY